MGSLFLLLVFGIPIVAIVTKSMERMQRLRLQQGGEASPRLEALEAEVQSLRQDLTETQERLDFAERMLAKNKQPSRQQIVSHMNGHLCRCGTYNRIVAAIQRAAKEA